MSVRVQEILTKIFHIIFIYASKLYGNVKYTLLLLFKILLEDSFQTAL